MRRQETFLDLTSDDARAEVVKTYDLKYAREAFDSMDESAYSASGALWVLNRRTIWMKSRRHIHLSGSIFYGKGVGFRARRWQRTILFRGK
jgi:hypothetical protein